MLSPLLLGNSFFTFRGFLGKSNQGWASASMKLLFEKIFNLFSHEEISQLKLCLKAGVPRYLTSLLQRKVPRSHKHIALANPFKLPPLTPVIWAVWTALQRARCFWYWEGRGKWEYLNSEFPPDLLGDHGGLQQNCVYVSLMVCWNKSNFNLKMPAYSIKNNYVKELLTRSAPD